MPYRYLTFFLLLMGPFGSFGQDCEDIEDQLEEFRSESRITSLAKGEAKSSVVSWWKGTPVGILYSLLDPTEMDVYKTAYIEHVKQIDAILAKEEGTADLQKLQEEIEGLKIAHQGIVIERELGNSPQCYQALQEFTTLFVEIGEEMGATSINTCNEDFQASVVEDDEGYEYLEVTALTNAPCLQPINEDNTYKTWGVLICYKSNGEQRVARQDMSRKLVEEGKYTYRLSYSKNTVISDVSTTFFDATRESSTYPEKNCN